MASTCTVKADFCRRLRAIPKLGLGLSVDVYSPDLFTLMGALVLRGLNPAYLEIFKASNAALAAVRARYPEMPLTYHGEGLWVTQPDFQSAPSLDEDLAETARQLRTLGSYWLNHECATKQMAGYSFGTYLPPLYTGLSAAVVADNVAFVQERLDRDYGEQTRPLFLLEMAPLTYFAAGTLEVPEFFRLITDRVACGLVLDIGHLWTLYRYLPGRHEQSLERFVGKFLDEFPLERVVEIHVAGLAEHGVVREERHEDPSPDWLDSHAAPIPAVLLDMLEQALSHAGLVSLRGMALEVDTKSIPLIVEEFASAVRRFGDAVCRKMADESLPQPDSSPAGDDQIEVAPPAETERKLLGDDYTRYARIVSGQAGPTGFEWQGVAEDERGLGRYIHEYLPHEIQSWGGKLTEMFPDTCRALAQEHVSLDGFVTWWFKTPRSRDRPYDFFLLKIDRLLDFVDEFAPAVRPVAEREAGLLRRAYSEANESVVQPALPEAAR